MHQNQKNNSRSFDLTIHTARSLGRQKVMVILLFLGWTLVVGLAVWYQDRLQEGMIFDAALVQARALVDKDIVYRIWNSRHGGVYVPVTEGTQPNPYLTVPDRDVITTDGRRLTLINPAYMARQIHELQRSQIGIQGHLTSLKPLNPHNAPDPWEVTALKEIETGRKEIIRLVDIDGRKYMRFMKPMVMTEACLKCHEHQGYKVGQIRGGLGVLVPMDPVVAAHEQSRQSHHQIYLLFWLLGTAGLALGYFWVRHSEEDRIQAEDKIRNLSMAVEQSPASVVVTDLEGNIQYVNPKFTNVTGYSFQEAIGQNPRILKSGIHPPEYYQELWRTITEGRVWRGEFRNKKKNGEFYWELAAIAPVSKPDGTITSFLAVKEDITERKQDEDALREAKERAEEANRVKSVFMANLSHEFRTPMNGIIGMTELALATPLNQEQTEYLSLIKSSAESLAFLLNDLLDFSKIEAGRLDFDPIPFTLRDFLGKAVRSVAHRAHEKGLELVSIIESGVPDDLVGDPSRLRQILINLLDNAFKFTEKGEVVLQVRLEEENPERVELKFTVSDTGIGVPADKQQAIFEAFIQADSSTTRKYGGTGLGLAITTRLVQMFGGKIWVESQIGQGSTFHFTACFKHASTPGIKTVPLAPEKLKDLPALIVDDNFTARRILTDVLKNWGLKPTAVEDGSAALSVVKETYGSGGAFALIILDSQMPEMDGFELARRLKADPALDQAVFIMLTSSASRGDAARCREIGICGYLPKPVRQEELLELITAVLGGAWPSGIRENKMLITRHTLTSGGPHLRILVAEDNLVNQRLAQRILEKNGHLVKIVSNGRKALAALEEEGYDLVLMDIQMPEMDGLDAVNRIREKEKVTGRHQPVVAMTAFAMKGDRERFLAAGMDGYLPKPIRTERLLEVLREITGLDREITELDDRIGRKPSKEKIDQTIDFDLSGMLDRVGGDEDLLCEMVTIFLEELPSRLAEIEKAVTGGRREDLEKSAHYLKGSIGYFSTKAAFQAAKNLVENARSGQMAGTVEIYESLEHEVTRLKEALETWRSTRIAGAA